MLQPTFYHLATFRTWQAGQPQQVSQPVDVVQAVSKGGYQLALRQVPRHAKIGMQQRCRKGARGMPAAKVNGAAAVCKTDAQGRSN